MTLPSTLFVYSVKYRVAPVFLTPAVDLTFLSSSLVREVAALGGDVGDFVHPVVKRALGEKLDR